MRVAAGSIQKRILIVVLGVLLAAGWATAANAVKFDSDGMRPGWLGIDEFVGPGVATHAGSTYSIDLARGFGFRWRRMIAPDPEGDWIRWSLDNAWLGSAELRYFLSLEVSGGHHGPRFPDHGGWFGRRDFGWGADWRERLEWWVSHHHGWLAWCLQHQPHDVPEPTTAALLGLGLGGLQVSSARFRKLSRRVSAAPVPPESQAI